MRQLNNLIIKYPNGKLNTYVIACPRAPPSSLRARASFPVPRCSAALVGRAPAALDDAVVVHAVDHGGDGPGHAHGAGPLGGAQARPEQGGGMYRIVK